MSFKKETNASRGFKSIDFSLTISANGLQIINTLSHYEVTHYTVKVVLCIFNPVSAAPVSKACKWVRFPESGNTAVFGGGTLAEGEVDWRGKKSKQILQRLGKGNCPFIQLILSEDLWRSFPHPHLPNHLVQKEKLRAGDWSTISQ